MTPLVLGSIIPLMLIKHQTQIEKSLTSLLLTEKL